MHYQTPRAEATPARCLARRLAFVPLMASLALAAESSAAPMAAGPIKVYVLAGQSNMGGGATTSDVPAELADPQDVLYQFRMQTGAAYLDTSDWESLRVLAPGYPGTNWGLELSFGAAMHARSAAPVAIVKVAANGTNLAHEWHPATAGGWYDSLLDKTRASLQQLSAQGYQPQIAGFVWVQGEGDAALLDRAQAYDDNLLLLAHRFRRDLNVPDMLFAYNELHIAADREYKMELRQSQRNAAAADPLMRLINADDLRLGGDGLHFTAPMHVAIGERFADVFAPSADFNDDGRVDGHDLAVWRASFHLGIAGDANADGQSDGSDFLHWQRQLSAPRASGKIEQIPEPASGRLVLLALAVNMVSCRYDAIVIPSARRNRFRREGRATLR